MRYLALAMDYDGTLSSDDSVSEQAIRALEGLRISGRQTILVTGRRLDDLLAVCSPHRLVVRITTVSEGDIDLKVEISTDDNPR